MSEEKDKLEEINKLYDETVNTSYFSSLLTPRSHKMQSYENVISKYIEYLSQNQIEKSVKIEIYNKIITLYTYLNNQDNIIKYKLERYSILTNEELFEELGNIKEIEILKFLNSSHITIEMKIKLYEYLIKNLNLKDKYLSKFVDYIILLKEKKTEIDFNKFIPYIEDLFKSNLRTVISRKYAELLIQIDKSKLDYCCKLDPLPSNIDYYKSL
jgi:hypothetical protein